MGFMIQFKTKIPNKQYTSNFFSNIYTFGNKS